MCRVENKREMMHNDSIQRVVEDAIEEELNSFPDDLFTKQPLVRLMKEENSLDLLREYVFDEILPMFVLDFDTKNNAMHCAIMNEIDFEEVHAFLQQCLDDR